MTATSTTTKTPKIERFSELTRQRVFWRFIDLPSAKQLFHFVPTISFHFLWYSLYNKRMYLCGYFMTSDAYRTHTQALRKLPERHEICKKHNEFCLDTAKWIRKFNWISTKIFTKCFRDLGGTFLLLLAFVCIHCAANFRFVIVVYSRRRQILFVHKIILISRNFSNLLLNRINSVGHFIFVLLRN